MSDTMIKTDRQLAERRKCRLEVSGSYIGALNLDGIRSVSDSVQMVPRSGSLFVLATEQRAMVRVT